ncbi:hypothetical protein LA080_002544 [Diaporthe eres]|nr:hypothetical protein LA080_002544 [Diaporthe eres]
MANKKSSGAEITEAERNDPNAAWEATITKGMKETESEMFLQWISIIMIGQINDSREAYDGEIDRYPESAAERNLYQ